VDIKPDTTKIEQPKNPTKADKAKAIYDEMIKDPKNDRQAIIARLKKEVGLTKAGAQTYYYKFQRDSGRVVEKQPSKMDKAKEVFEKMTFDGQSRKEIIVAFVKEVGLTKAGASTYFQTLKKSTVKPAKVEKAS
jgi:predicted solute-binding protein